MIAVKTKPEKTQGEINNLKAQWRHDPCWDIEDTEGFEAHYDELIAYRIETEKTWREERDRERFEEVDRRATELKCSMELAEYTLILENKISRLQDKVEELWHQSRI